MTIGPRPIVDLVAGITSFDHIERDSWAGSAGFELADPYSGIDDDERRAIAPSHAWGMCIESSVQVREGFLNSLDSFACGADISSILIAEILGWLKQTGTNRMEADYVETFTDIVARTGAVAEIPLTPERAAPFVDVLRGITSASEHERTRAAGIVADLLLDLRLEEQWGFTGVLARAAVVEEDQRTRGEQLRVLVVADELGAVHVHDRELLVTSLEDAPHLAEIERQALTALRSR